MAGAGRAEREGGKMIDQEKLQGRRVVASISGGKDSGAMSLYLHELGIEHDRVFLDTGWEHPATYEYLRGPLTDKLGPITEVSSELKMVDLILRKGIFPSRRMRWCTDELKMKPLAKHLSTYADDVISAVGIRAAESEARSKMAEWEYSPGLDCDVWRPLLTWSEADVIAIHKRHGLAPNPLYLSGAERVGCWPCVMSRKAEIRLVAESDPERIALIRDLESQLTERLTMRCLETGEAQRWPELTFFQGSGSADRQNGQTWPIDKVVAWSRTSHGGKQLELFAPLNEGCVRWGLCDAGRGPGPGTGSNH